MSSQIESRKNIIKWLASVLFFILLIGTVHWDNIREHIFQNIVKDNIVEKKALHTVTFILGLVGGR